MYGNSGAFSYFPRGFSPEDLPQSRRPFQQDDPKGSPLQRNGMSRPTGRSIYMQRKEYSEALNRQPDNFHIRVEHLFTCELDGQETKTLEDCVARLKRLDSKGRLWPQEMIMEVQRGYLVLSDIETKAELESMPLSSILQTKAVLDSCAYNSLLMITVQEHSKRITQVFMFQCEETGADIIKTDLDKSIQSEGSDLDQRREPSDIRINLENIIGKHTPGGYWQPGPRASLQRRTPSPPDHMAPQWNNREMEEEPMHHPDLHELQSSTVASEKAEIQRNTEILNHVISDIEIFVGKVTTAANSPTVQETKTKKKKKKTKKHAAEPVIILPSLEEYVSYLQKIKYGFNLLGQLAGALTQPSAPEFVHIFFSYLNQIFSLYPTDLPPTVLSPLLIEKAVGLLSQVVNPEEDQLWKSLGDSWNIPRSRWPNDDVPPYIPEFYDGWQPPPPAHVPSSPPPMRRSNSQRFPPGHPNGQIDEGYSPRASLQRPEEPAVGNQWGPPSHSSEPPQYMHVMYDFTARNPRELSVMKGDVVQVIQKGKQWWLVRNRRNEEGNVLQHILEPLRNPIDDVPRSTGGPVTLDMTSPPAEVKAWLEYKGFSRITVSSLGVLSGKLLLGMTKEEIRTVCPEEGAKVFFQLQAVKSAVALASEPSSLYNGRY
ncbi:epidermal growth factor receptor kinase substrate 8-like protein 3b isoform X2 [Parambassis ranga]|uniref:Epidermal growth factor receptor kinase substrate 8-like protein 3b isoform X2 n=1 Tax=Parambassis ranga TaxID=210632 RepID=A0A6P7IUP6_9TELE|nr:epidermal growth factor receptor kinase substrate 8-like protein 3 isoform X2 [Parambassis ranga]